MNEPQVSLDFSLLMTWLRGEGVTNLQEVVLMLGPLESQKKRAVYNMVETEERRARRQFQLRAPVRLPRNATPS